eukprot:gene6165-10172_t
MKSIIEATNIISRSNNLCVLIGAGLSSESGIPTFRGQDGYWKVGSKNYHPETLATNSFFYENPKSCWEWYEYRRKKCLASQPNEGHYSLVKLEKIFKKLKKEIHIVTQNVDGLNLRAGQDPELTFEIHGNINYMRNSETEEDKTFPISENSNLDSDGLRRIPNTNDLARPHILWFDEYYTEELYKYESALKVSSNCDALLFVGTTLLTTLPSRIVDSAISRKIPIIEINIEPIGKNSILCVQGKSGEILPKILRALESVK